MHIITGADLANEPLVEHLTFDILPDRTQHTGRSCGLITLLLVYLETILLEAIPVSPNTK